MNEKSSWRIFFQPASEKQFSSLTAKVELLKNKYPDSYQKKKSTKILAAIRQIIITLSIDPTQPIFRQGKTLGDQYLNWHRLKFFQQYRLFFRYQTSAKIVVIGWVNGDSTLRAYESKTMPIEFLQRCSTTAILLQIGMNCFRHLTSATLNFEPFTECL